MLVSKLNFVVVVGCSWILGQLRSSWVRGHSGRSEAYLWWTGWRISGWRLVARYERVWTIDGHLAMRTCGQGNAKCYRYIIDIFEMLIISLTYRYLDSPTAWSAFPDQSPLNHRNACDNVAAAAVQVAAV